MANLGKKDGIFHVRFRFRGKEFKRSLRIRERSDAEAAKNLVKLSLHRLMTGQIDLPPDVDVGDFIVSGGTLKEPPPPVEEVRRPSLPSTKQLIENYKTSQKNLLAESYHDSQASAAVRSGLAGEIVMVLATTMMLKSRISDSFRARADPRRKK